MSADTQLGQTGIPAGTAIICFANDWAADPLSKKQVMRRLARRHRVLWINSINNRRPQLAKKDFSRAFQKLATFGRGLKQVEENVWVLAPLYLPFHGNALARRFNRWFLGWQIRRAQRKLKFERPVTWTYVPTSADVVGTLGEQLVVYHCVDEYAAFSDAAPEVLEREKELLRKSGLVIVCSDALLESKQKSNPRTYLVTHGVDYEHFRKATEDSTPVPEELRAIPRPILGFHGLLADWVDIPLLAELARRRPEWSLVFVGRSDTDISALEGLPNVHLLGHRPYERLPDYLRGFDVALLPFVQNKLTINANPLKLREYLAAGLPVVAAPIPEIARMGALVELAATAEEYERIIARLVGEGRTGPSRERSDEVRDESWDAKVEEMERLAAACLVPGIEEALRLHPVLRELDVESCGHWKARHSDLYEYRSRRNHEERYLVKVITSGDTFHEAGAAIERERCSLERIRALVGAALAPTLPEPLATLPELGA
ncbi:MAG TPA: glycosyltransferase, partial [Candidatus Acidoferrales bacterium]